MTVARQGSHSLSADSFANVVSSLPHGSDLVEICCAEVWPLSTGNRLTRYSVLLYTEVVVNKIPASWRLSADALRLLTELAEKMGISKAAVLETAIRLLAKKEHVE